MTIIIDPGHGGKDPQTGEYVTAPSKMYSFDNGPTVEEGVVNRQICEYLDTLLQKEHYETIWTVRSHHDKSLWDRVQFERNLRERDKKDTLFISVHNNAGGGEGMECYSFPGSKKSMLLNNSIYSGFADILPEYPRRYTRGEKGKTAEFYVLKYTFGPAALVECGFMDNLRDAEMMLSDEGQKAYAEAIVQGIQHFNNR